MNARNNIGRSPRQRNLNNSPGQLGLEALIRRSTAAASARDAGIQRSEIPFRDRILEQSAKADCPTANMLKHKALLLLFGDEDEEDGFGVSEVEVSIVCPYSRLLIKTAVRSSECAHVACADIDSWCQALEKGKAMKDPKAVCPVCGEWRRLSTLSVDRWMQFLIEQAAQGTTSIIIFQDGTVREKENTGPSSRRGARVEEVDLLTQSSQDSPMPVVKQEGHPSVLIKDEPGEDFLPTYTISDEDDDDDEEDADRRPALRGIEDDTLEVMGDISGRFSEAPRPPQPPSGLNNGETQAAVMHTTTTPAITTAVPYTAPTGGLYNSANGGLIAVEYCSQPPISSTPTPSSVPVPLSQPGEFDRSSNIMAEWKPYCGVCSSTCAPVGTTNLYSCCQRTGHRLEWPLTFGVAHVGLMCTTDGYLIIMGNSADKFAARLYAAGFHRSPERDALYFGRLPPTFARYELDYLQAMCRIASQPDTSAQDCYKVYPTPALFRQEPPRTAPPGGYTPNFSQVGSTPQLSAPSPHSRW